MRKLLILIFVPILLIVLFGCASINTQVIDLSKLMVQTADTEKEFARNICKAWPINSEIVLGTCGDTFDKKTYDAIGILDINCALLKPTDKELSKVLYNWGRIMTKIGESGIDKVTSIVKLISTVIK